MATAGTSGAESRGIVLLPAHARVFAHVAIIRQWCVRNGSTRAHGKNGDMQRSPLGVVVARSRSLGERFLAEERVSESLGSTDALVGIVVEHPTK
jgi:hypothetical protein